MIDARRARSMLETQCSYVMQFKELIGSKFLVTLGRRHSHDEAIPLVHEHIRSLAQLQKRKAFFFFCVSIALLACICPVLQFVHLFCEWMLAKLWDGENGHQHFLPKLSVSNSCLLFPQDRGHPWLTGFLDEPVTVVNNPAKLTRRVIKNFGFCRCRSFLFFCARWDNAWLLRIRWRFPFHFHFQRPSFTRRRERLPNQNSTGRTRSSPATEIEGRPWPPRNPRTRGFFLTLEFPRATLKGQGCRGRRPKVGRRSSSGKQEKTSENWKPWLRRSGLDKTRRKRLSNTFNGFRGLTSAWAEHPWQRAPRPRSWIRRCTPPRRVSAVSHHREVHRRPPWSKGRLPKACWRWWRSRIPRRHPRTQLWQV